MGSVNTFDHAYEIRVDWNRERCATCARKLPRLDDDGSEALAWKDDALEAVFCTGCYLRWYRREYQELDEAADGLDLPPLAQEVIRALIRREGVLTFTEAEHMAKVLGDLDASDYEALPVWKARRDRFLAIQPRPLRCELCLAVTHAPQVHHRTYERMTRELDADLAILCDDCHVTIHKPHLRQAKRHFHNLQRDFEAKRLLEAICWLLPRWGWMEPAADVETTL